MNSRLTLAALASASGSVWIFFHSAALLIGLGLLDASFIPLPGGLDALLIFYVSRNPKLWLYFAFMATAGAIVGGIVTYRISHKGGEEALRKKLGKRSEKIIKGFARWGFWSVLLGSMAPPPVPTTAFVAAAGALQYSFRKFLIALAIGRTLRYLLVGFITLRYGQGIFKFFSRYYKPALWTLIVLAVVGGAAGAWFYFREKRKRDAEVKREPQQRAA